MKAQLKKTIWFGSATDAATSKGRVIFCIACALQITWHMKVLNDSDQQEERKKENHRTRLI